MPACFTYSDYKLFAMLKKWLPIKATLKLSRWEEIEWTIIKYYLNYNYVVFERSDEPHWSWSWYSLNPWQFRTRIIDWKEVLPEDLLVFLRFHPCLEFNSRTITK